MELFEPQNGSKILHLEGLFVLNQPKLSMWLEKVRVPIISGRTSVKWAVYQDNMFSFFFSSRYLHCFVWLLKLICSDTLTLLESVNVCILKYAFHIWTTLFNAVIVNVKCFSRVDLRGTGFPASGVSHQCVLKAVVCLYQIMTTNMQIQQLKYLFFFFRQHLFSNINFFCWTFGRYLRSGPCNLIFICHLCVCAWGCEEKMACNKWSQLCNDPVSCLYFSLDCSERDKFNFLNFLAFLKWFFFWLQKLGPFTEKCDSYCI